MPIFTKNKPVTQAAPRVKVEFASEEPLPLGANRFRLVVIDDAGNESEPTTLDVVVLDNAKPTAVLDMVDGNGRRVEPQVKQGDTFILSGARSTDQGEGKVVKYSFEWIDRD